MISFDLDRVIVIYGTVDYILSLKFHHKLFLYMARLIIPKSLVGPSISRMGYS